MPVVQSNSQNGWFATNDDELVHNAARHMEKSKFGRSPAVSLRFIRGRCLRVANFEKNERFQLRTSNEEVVRTNALNALKILLVSFSATRYFLVFNRHHSMSIEH